MRGQDRPVGFAVGAAMVLAVTTALISSGAGESITSPAEALAAFLPGLVLVTAVAATGLVVVVAPLACRNRPDTDVEMVGRSGMPGK